MPEAPSERIGCSRPSQLLKSPTTLTARAFGAQTANAVPATPSTSRHVRAEPLVQLLVPALAGEVEVELAERRQERVRVVERERVAVRVGDLELVARAAASRPRQLPSKRPARMRAGSSSTARRPSARTRDRRRVGPEGADDDAAVVAGARPSRWCGSGGRAGRSRSSFVPSTVTRRSGSSRAGARCRRPGFAPSRAGCRARSAARRRLLELEDREQPLDRASRRRQDGRRPDGRAR